MDDEKKAVGVEINILPQSSAASDDLNVSGRVDKDPFAADEGEVEFRTVPWYHAALFFLKMTFAVGVLSIPGAFYTMGLAGGLVSVVGWGALNTYMAYLMGQFKLKHPGMHALPDAARIMMLDLGYNAKYAAWAMNITDGFYLLTWVLAAGVSMLGLTIALNAVSRHATCTVVFSIVSYLVITSVASVRKVSQLAWIPWIGFVSIVVAIMIVVVAVALEDRPSAAPATGDFDLGFSWVPAPGATFSSFFSASLAVFSSSGNTPGYIPVLSEMKNPRDYNKALFTCMSWINISYIVLPTVVYYYCGKWVASPALGSAGPKFKIISYSIAIPGLIAGAMTVTHIAGKSLFVRILRDSRHLKSSTKIHWITWLSCTFGIGFLGWLLAEAIPFFGSLVSLIGSLCYGPVSVTVPALMWFNLNPNARKSESVRVRMMWWWHAAIVLLGLFITIGGTYAVVAEIVKSFASGNLGGAFSCEDNSGTIAH